VVALAGGRVSWSMTIGRGAAPGRTLRFGGFEVATASMASKRWNTERFTPTSRSWISACPRSTGSTSRGNCAHRCDANDPADCLTGSASGPTHGVAAAGFDLPWSNGHTTSSCGLRRPPRQARPSPSS